MTYEQVKRLHHMGLEIKEMAGRIKEIETAMKAPTRQMDWGNTHNQRRDRLREMVPELADLKRRYGETLARAREEYEEAVQWIDEVTDPFVRMILRYRYLDGLTWHQVAFKIGNNTADSVRMAVNRYVDRMDSERAAE